MDLKTFFEKNFSSCMVDEFDSKYLPYELLKKYLDQHFPDKKCIGQSYLSKEIFLLKIGSGPIKVLAWSQMHGNESTGTRAMFDVLSLLRKEELSFLKNKISLYFVPMLNPDGATNYTRRNACNIDINRDFHQEASLEIVVLKKWVELLQPDYMFNLHDQRTIFNVGDTDKAATLAFLAPSFDPERSIDEVRAKAMAVINHVAGEMQAIIPGHVARFSDEFYPNSTGDNFIKMGIPTVLIESGHYPNDYQRDKVRKFTALSILLALEEIAQQNEASIGSYFEIPENKQRFFDVVLRNVQFHQNKHTVITDLGLQFEDSVHKESGAFESHLKVKEIGDLSEYFGHWDEDVDGDLYQGANGIFPEIGELAHFSVGKLRFENGIYVG